MRKHTIGPTDDIFTPVNFKANIKAENNSQLRKGE